MALTTSRRRWLAGAVLFGAAGMLVAGETVLKSKLIGLWILVYWLACLALTVVAIILALSDLRTQGENARKAQRELLETTLREIQSSAQTRNHPGGGHRSKPTTEGATTPED